MGLQHAFAMVGGLITPPLVVTKFSICGFPFCTDLQQYAISAALITSGICTIINILKIPIPGTKYFIGSGVLSVMGTSFTFLPIFQIAIGQMKADGIEGTEAFGKMIGTSAVCALLELVFSVMPSKVLRKTFPPIVSSITVILIGVALTGTGMKYWGGGVVCAEMNWRNHGKIVVIRLFEDTFNSKVYLTLLQPKLYRRESAFPHLMAHALLGTLYFLLVHLNLSD